MTVRMLDQFSQAPDLTDRLDTVQDFFVQLDMKASIRNKGPSINDVSSNGEGCWNLLSVIRNI